MRRWHWRRSSCAGGCRYRPSSGTCARGRLLASVRSSPTCSRAVVPVEPLESSDTVEPGWWASIWVPPVRTGCADIVNSAEPAPTLRSARHGQWALFCSSLVRETSSKRRAWGAAQAMRAFRTERSAVRTVDGAGGPGALLELYRRRGIAVRALRESESSAKGERVASGACRCLSKSLEVQTS